jgi:hypothetical protein
MGKTLRERLLREHCQVIRKSGAISEWFWVDPKCWFGLRVDQMFMWDITVEIARETE